MSKLSLWVMILALLGLSYSAKAQESGPLMGTPRDIAAVVEFGAIASQAWQPKAGQNVTWSAQCGYGIPGVAANLMRIDLQLKDVADHEPGHNWFASEWANVPAGVVPADAEGIHFTLGSLSPVQWWVSFDLSTDDGQVYSNVIADQAFPPGRTTDFVVPFGSFKTKAGQALTAAKATHLHKIGFALGGASVQPRTFFLERITAYRRPRYESWVSFTTSHVDNNLFYRDEPVTISFAAGGKPQAGATGLAFEIRDYSGAVADSGTIQFKADTSKYDVTPKSLRDGYYEVKAFFTDAAGNRLADVSCIRSEGSVPEGLGTFAILPLTQQQTVERRKQVGQIAFFGLHGDFLGIADHLGVSWHLDYTHWRYLQPAKPDRAKGDAPWVAERLKQPARPDYEFNFQPFVFNIRSGLPDWEVSTGSTPPAFKSWDDALAVVRDYVRVEKHSWPHQKPRIYGGAWEVNLNMQPYISQQPEYKPEDVVELYRRIREVVKAEDPDALIAGPNPSTLDLKWYEPIFKAGLLKYVDAIETHAYEDAVFTPEENDTAGRIQRLNELIRRYNDGNLLPIYVTERGTPGVIGANANYREQAQIMARSCIILKGEGVRAYHPFYGIDYDAYGFGFCFNLQMEGPGGPWATKRISPKPMMNAVATCVRLLEGAAPKERLKGFDADVWAYVFENGTQQITAIWTMGKPRTINIAAPAGRVEVVSMMGASLSAPVVQGQLAVEIGQAPVYVVTAKDR